MSTILNLGQVASVSSNLKLVYKPYPSDVGERCFHIAKTLPPGAAMCSLRFEPQNCLEHIASRNRTRPKARSVPDIEHHAVLRSMSWEESSGPVAFWRKARPSAMLLRLSPIKVGSVFRTAAQSSESAPAPLRLRKYAANSENTALRS